MLMTNEELPEFLMNSATLERAFWRLAVGLYQAQIKYNKNKPVEQQSNILTIEIKNEENQMTGVITVTNLPIKITPTDAYIAPVEIFGIQNYQAAPESSSSFPWVIDWREGFDTFFHLLIRLAYFQVSEEYNPNSNEFIDLSISQSTTLNDFPMSVSSTVTFPVSNIDSIKDFLCIPKEVITGKSPWKVTTP